MNQTEGKTPYLDIRVATSTTTTTTATRATVAVATTSKSKWQMVGYIRCINYVSYNCSHFRPSQMQTRKRTTKERKRKKNNNTMHTFQLFQTILDSAQTNTHANAFLFYSFTLLVFYFNVFGYGQRSQIWLHSNQLPLLSK